MPNKEAMRQAMVEMAKAEIGAGVTKVPIFWRVIARAKSKEEFWELWSKETEETISQFPCSPRLARRVYFGGAA